MRALHINLPLAVIKMNKQKIIEWLLQGDISIQYQVCRDLLGNDRKDLQERIANEGWGKQFLSKRKSDGHWRERVFISPNGFLLITHC